MSQTFLKVRVGASFQSGIILPNVDSHAQSGENISYLSE